VRDDLGYRREYLEPGLDVWFVGSAMPRQGGEDRRYFAGPGNVFWRCLGQSGFTPGELEPVEDAVLPRFGIGLTDVFPGTSPPPEVEQRSRDVEGFLGKVELLAPRWIAFNGITPAKAVARHLSIPGKIVPGEQPWLVVASEVFVLPSTAGRNADPRNWGPYRSKCDAFVHLAEVMRHASRR